MEEHKKIIVKFEFVSVFQKLDIIKEFLKFCLENNYSANCVYSLIEYEDFLKKNILKNVSEED